LQLLMTPFVEAERLARERREVFLSARIKTGSNHKKRTRLWQGAVLRLLDDQISLRLAANERGTTYMVLRLKVLEFLDVTADTLTTDHFAEFVRPRIARWDVDLETGVLRVSLRSQEPRQRPRAPRAPASS